MTKVRRAYATTCAHFYWNKNDDNETYPFVEDPSPPDNRGWELMSTSVVHDVQLSMSSNVYDDGSGGGRGTGSTDIAIIWTWRLEKASET